MTQRQLVRMAGIEESSLSRRMNQTGGLSLPAIEAVLAALTTLEQTNTKD